MVWILGQYNSIWYILTWDPKIKSGWVNQVHIILQKKVPVARLLQLFLYTQVAWD